MGFYSCINRACKIFVILSLFGAMAPLTSQGAENGLPPFEVIEASTKLISPFTDQDRSNILMLRGHNYIEVIEALVNRLHYEVGKGDKVEPEIVQACLDSLVVTAHKGVIGALESAQDLARSKIIDQALLASVENKITSAIQPLSKIQPFPSPSLESVIFNTTAGRREPGGQEVVEYYYEPGAGILDYRGAERKGDAALFKRPGSQKAESDGVIRSPKGGGKQPVDRKARAQFYQALDRAHRERFKYKGPGAFDAALESIAQERQYIEARLKGQPELIEALMNLRLNDFFLGRLQPQKIVLMGPPGVGKDTAAEVYTDAIHQEDGAHLRHMYRLPPLRSEADLWGQLGSKTGYLGSDNFPPFLKFLVDHSGGRYQLEEVVDSTGKKTFKVVETVEWIEGRPIGGKLGPESAVVFVNEFHTWTKEMKDALLKEAWEKGYFTINNPNGGISELYVPVTFIIGTNEGMALITSRELNGQRYGEIHSYDEMIEKWEAVHEDKDRLRLEMQRTNGGINSGTNAKARGISEELLNRITDEEVLLLRPHSLQTLKQIAELKSSFMVTEFRYSQVYMGPLEITWSDELVKFVTEYRYNPEVNARPIQGKVKSLIKSPLLNAFRTQKIQPRKNGQRLVLDVRRNKDKTYNLVINIEALDTGASIKTEEVLIPPTVAERERAAIRDDEIDALTERSDTMRTQVFGVDEIIAELEKATILGEEARRAKVEWHEVKDPADVYMFLGLSSTGKTETAKALAEYRYKRRSSMKVFDFSNIQTVYQLQERILGKRDPISNDPIPSDFMKEWDRNNGHFLAVFDELANAPMEVIMGLYDILREPAVTTFSDGRPRPMNGLTIILTGNAGEGFYKDVPRNIPESQQLAAMEEIHKQVMADPHSRRLELEKYFSEAFLARVGEENIFMFGPLTFKTIRQLAHYKLLKAIENLDAIEARRGWRVRFASKEDYYNIVSGIEEAGFVLRDQGASIDRFARKFERELRFLLLKYKVPSGNRVTVSFETLEGNSAAANGRSRLVLKIKAEGQTEAWPLSLQGKQLVKTIRNTPTNKILTAYHEAGHEIVRQVYFGDSYRGTEISIIPGVTRQGQSWVYFAGFSAYKEEVEVLMTREAVVRRIAVLAAGEVAQSLITKGSRHDEGKQNDMERATKLAQLAVLKWGMSESFGRMSVPSDQTLDGFIAQMSDRQTEALHKEVRSLLVEGHSLARKALIYNFENALLPMGQLLAEKGRIGRRGLEKFYEEHALIVEENMTTINYLKNLKNRTVLTGLAPAVDYLIGKFRGGTKRDAELRTGISVPNKVVDIDELMAMKKQRAVENVHPTSAIPLVDGEAHSFSDCYYVLENLDNNK